MDARRKQYLDEWKHLIETNPDCDSIYKYKHCSSGFYDRERVKSLADFSYENNVFYKMISASARMSVYADPETSYNLWLSRFKHSSVVVYDKATGKFYVVTDMPKVDTEIDKYLIFKLAEDGVHYDSARIKFCDGKLKIVPTNSKTKEKDSMVVKAKERDDEFVTKCSAVMSELTDLDKLGKWYGVIYDEKGNCKGSKEFRNKQHAKQYVTYREQLGYTVVLFKRYKSYTADIPVVEGK